MNDHKTASVADASGIGLSLLCMAHCFILPVVTVVAPALMPELSDSFFQGESAHFLLLAIAAPVSIAAFVWGARISRAGWRTLTAAGVGLLLMLIGASHVFGSTWETVLTLVGVTILAGAHFVNWRSRARLGHDHEEECVMCEGHSGDGPAEPDGQGHDSESGLSMPIQKQAELSTPANDRGPRASVA